jgi:hypothetical protein
VPSTFITISKPHIFAFMFKRGSVLGNLFGQEVSGFSTRVVTCVVSFSACVVT